MPKDLTPVGPMLRAIIKPEHNPFTPIQERLLTLSLPAAEKGASS
jgi:hypothetical protein